MIQLKIIFNTGQKSLNIHMATKVLNDMEHTWKDEVFVAMLILF